MRRLLILCAFPWLLAADDHWVKFTGGPYEVLTDAGARAGRETLVRFEELTELSQKRRLARGIQSRGAL